MFRKTLTGTILILTVAIFGCSLEHAPLIKQEKFENLPLSPGHDSLSTWALDTLRPVENTVLTDGQVSPVSVRMAASGTGNYFVQLWGNGKKFRPFKVSILQTPLSQAHFSGTIIWFVKVKGRNEHIIVRLYRVEISEAGDTKVTTLMREIQRNFGVICNKKGFFIVRFFKEHIFCTCKLSDPKKKN
ncbi:hypothetical protein HDF18_17890 [Mucilaginibacter sp. X5P1]|uniref:hypothetical protein n=1 Tax=Mucilaginibacter sp. X5P1 TaxID=2723088 RepID=UPI001617DF7D|nr:hypothetical protein [Mucilaginibacter sp. X5P1]MBB6139510.1 hypothetical protein [Mucilaginibacter sp. X5P1]